MGFSVPSEFTVTPEAMINYAHEYPTLAADAFEANLVALDPADRDDIAVVIASKAAAAAAENFKHFGLLSTHFEIANILFEAAPEAAAKHVGTFGLTSKTEFYFAKQMARKHPTLLAPHLRNFDLEGSDLFEILSLLLKTPKAYATIPGSCFYQLTDQQAKILENLKINKR